MSITFQPDSFTVESTAEENARIERTVAMRGLRDPEEIERYKLDALAHIELEKLATSAKVEPNAFRSRALYVSWVQGFGIIHAGEKARFKSYYPVERLIFGQQQDAEALLREIPNCKCLSINGPGLMNILHRTGLRIEDIFEHPDTHETHEFVNTIGEMILTGSVRRLLTCGFRPQMLDGTWTPALADASTNEFLARQKSWTRRQHERDQRDGIPPMPQV